MTPSGTAGRSSPRATGGLKTLFMPAPAASVTRPNALQAVLGWDGAIYPLALVRTSATGQTFSFARGGQATIWTRAAAPT